MSTAAARLIAAVTAGEADGMFPPVVEPGPDGVLMPSRYLSGPLDAAYLDKLLRQPRLRPLVRMLSDLDDWCDARSREFTAIVAPGLLRSSNAQLFGPLVTEVFTGCMLGEFADLDGFSAIRLAQQQHMLDEFFDRLRRDRQSAWTDDPKFRGRVEELAPVGDETHNGGKRAAGDHERRRPPGL